MSDRRADQRATPAARLRLPALALLPLLLALCAPTAGADTWYESYHKAEQALANEQWSEAVRQLHAALEQKPDSAANTRTYGMRFIEYFPYLQLGIAYYHLGQAEAALQAFETEQRQGEIDKSAPARALLASYRERIESERAEREDARRRRAREVAAASLAEARTLESQGQLEDALGALDRVLAVAPDHAEARAAKERLRAALAERVRRERERQRLEARERPGAEPVRAVEDRPRPPAGGGPEPAAEDPLPQARAEADESRRQADEIDRLLAEAAALLAAGDPAGALRAANRVLVLDPVNGAALRHITQAYARLSDALLAADGAPPAIFLDREPPAGEGEVPTEVVRAPEVEVSGTVYAGTPVEVRVLERGEPVGAAEVAGREFQGVWITDFRWRHRVPPGPSEYELVAVDRAGHQATAWYRVEYAVPFLRSAWFPASLAGGLALCAVGLVAARARHRRRLLRERFNPYVAGAPILEHARFFGRRQLLDYVLRRICNNSVMLYGERRIGKTSLQHQLKRLVAGLDDPAYEFYPVFIDLQGTPQEKFFATLAAEVFHELAPKLGGLQPQAPPGSGAYDYRELVRDLQRVLKALESRTAKKVKLVLLIDEVDELNDYDPRINQRLRSLFMRAFADNLVTVVSGVSIKKTWEREGSPWYNFFQEIEVKPLDPAEARALIEAPVRGVFGFEDGAADEIIRRTASKPYLIQRLCSSLVDRMHEERRRRITRADVETACRIEGL